MHLKTFSPVSIWFSEWGHLHRHEACRYHHLLLRLHPCPHPCQLGRSGQEHHQVNLILLQKLQKNIWFSDGAGALLICLPMVRYPNRISGQAILGQGLEVLQGRLGETRWWGWEWRSYSVISELGVKVTRLYDIIWYSELLKIWLI